jgi:hypothetical protein
VRSKVDCRFLWQEIVAKKICYFLGSSNRSRGRRPEEKSSQGTFCNIPIVNLKKTMVSQHIEWLARTIQVLMLVGDLIHYSDPDLQLVFF